MITYQKQIPEREKADVFIAGGGPAGVAAAVTCARQGKKVFLAETLGAFGGSGTVGLVPEFMNFDDGIHFLAGGFGAEVCQALFGYLPEKRKCMVIRVEEVKRLYDRLMVEAGVRFSFFTRVVDVVTDGSGRIKSAICAAKSGIFAVSADVFIDCTGDGDLAVMAGADFEMGGETGVTMPATLCSYWSGIDYARKTLNDYAKLEEAFADGVLSQEDRLLPGLKEIDREQGIAGGNIGHCFHVDATDEQSLTQAMLTGRKILQEYVNYYRTYIPGCEKATLCLSADILGVRESRRITGEAKLTLADFQSCAVFPDEIGRYSYPIDIHLESPDQESMKRFTQSISLRHGDGESYGIPYRALIPKKLQNCLVAGRCISTDRAIQASVRVIPGCYITGQAAGMAAALAENGLVRTVSVALLQEKLLKIGAYLPNA